MKKTIFEDQVSVTIHNGLSREFQHMVFYEYEEPFCHLMEGDFTAVRSGKEVALFLNSTNEILEARQITGVPLFIKF